jgi:hypothetical protein
VLVAGIPPPPPAAAADHPAAAAAAAPPGASQACTYTPEVEALLLPLFTQFCQEQYM